MLRREGGDEVRQRAAAALADLPARLNKFVCTGCPAPLILRKLVTAKVRCEREPAAYWPRCWPNTPGCESPMRCFGQAAVAQPRRPAVPEAATAAGSFALPKLLA
jgi:hypothetical protein